MIQQGRKLLKQITGSELGFTILELVVAGGICAIVAAATIPLTWRILNDTHWSNDHLTAMNGANNAAYWVGRDVGFADNVITDTVVPPNILIVKYKDWVYNAIPVTYTVTYSIENVTDNIGILKRRVQTTAGQDSQIRIADNVYYNANDTMSSTNVTFSDRTLKFKVVTRYDLAEEIREIEAYPRSNFILR